MRRWLRVPLWFLLGLVLLGASGWLVLGASLARLDGATTLPGLGAAATATRDARGTVTIQAADRADALRTLGYVHAQERFFQMDLMRRSAAGELAELVGAAALPLDRRHRLHRFRHVAELAVAALPAEQRRLLDAYAAGVNRGLGDLASRPWEYWLLGERPQPWRAEDSALAIYAMYLDLNDGENRRELDLARWDAVLPPALVAFLTTPGSAWDAPLRGGATPPPAVPPASVFDLRGSPPASAPLAALGPAVDEAKPGSNNFAVAGALTGGAALVADDMHLGLRVPNLWFRARLRYAGAGGAAVDLNGVTLPGAPGLVAGSNGRIAWGFTNSYGDWLDWVRVQRDPGDPQRYRVPEGWAALEHAHEVLHVHGGDAEALDVASTRWGPIMAQAPDGTPLALAWTAHDPAVLNLSLLDLDRVDSVTHALDLAPHLGMPVQNFVVGDAEGHIGWTLTGNALPRRAGIDPQRPSDWSQAGSGWVGWVDAAQYPRIEDPADGRLWSANARTLDGADLALVGDGGYDLGARAQQIRDDLRARPRWAAADALAVQLDDRALFLARWQALMARSLEGGDDPALAELRRLTAHWGGRAGIDAVDYRLVREFRSAAIERVLAPFVRPAQARFPDFVLPSAQGYEAAVWTLLQERPAHLLDPKFADWDALLREAARDVAQRLGAAPGGLAARRWGERNTAAIRHPLSRALPAFVARWLDMPAEPLPGDSNMPRVQAPSFGASERFGILPGREGESYLMMPGGQSDHPLSPFHGAGHADWVVGRPTPLLPGPERYRLRLTPSP